MREFFPFTDYFLPSIEEARALSGLYDMGEAARYFLGLGANACVFTLGGDGASYHDRAGVTFRMPAFEVAVKCSCGCGDAFNAGFAVGLVRGLDIEATVRFAQATAALNATGLGSQAGVESFEHTPDFANTARTRSSRSTAQARTPPGQRKAGKGLTSQAPLQNARRRYKCSRRDSAPDVA